MNVREVALNESQKLYSKLRKLSKDKITLLTVRDIFKGSLHLALVDNHKVFEIEIKMDKVSIPDKILFHKKSTEILYSDFMKETLAHSKSQMKIAKLESNLKQGKNENRAWKIEIKKLLSQVVEGNSRPIIEQVSQKEKPSTQVKTFKKNGRIDIPEPIISPHVIQLQQENEALKKYIMELRTKIIVIDNHKIWWELEKHNMEIIAETPRSILKIRSPTDEVVKAMLDIF